ncbi:MAG: 16S rRNA (cytidine(1402)-2'-O)-methyltransferase [Proteobacteria bacterium]|nr:16S rRNA (cytidine(1402)-2'-O)-methyltransferase [Pseudomonadota bacterium]
MTNDQRPTTNDIHLPAGLYIVGTPIGNLSDMSPRAVETLRGADLIACEDTRVAGKLAAHYDIKTPRIAMHEHNEREVADDLVAKIAGGGPGGAGMAVACISDSGMPAISDPGFRLIRAARAANVPVFVVPGPTAAVSALVLSGFPTDRWTFCGFLPATDAARDAALRNDNKIRHTIIYYESPARITSTISALAKIMPERRIAIVREITKIHEETIIGYPAELINIEPPRGEIVLVIEPAPDMKMSDDQINEIVRDVVANASGTKSAAAEVAARTGLSKSAAYEKVLKKG